MAGIEAVTFDLWFTLIAHDEFYDGKLREARTSAIREALASHGCEVPEKKITEAFETSEGYLREIWSRNADVDTPAQVDILLRCLGIDASPEVAAALERPYAEAVMQVEPFLVEGAEEALEALRASGVKLALISNTGRTPGRTMRRVMQRMGILDYFDVTTFSNETGYLKPDGRIFEATLARLGVTPGRAVHVGDHPVLDVQGSKAFGMKSVHVTRYSPKLGSQYLPDVAVESLREIPAALNLLNY